MEYLISGTMWRDAQTVFQGVISTELYYAAVLDGSEYGNSKISLYVLLGLLLAPQSTSIEVHEGNSTDRDTYIRINVSTVLVD
jgi:hypothetical protein